MDSIFSLTTCFALLGGFLGSLVVSDIKRYGKILTLILVVIGMVFAAAITKYTFLLNIHGCLLVLVFL